MGNKKLHIAIGCCAVFFCIASLHAQGYDNISMNYWADNSVTPSPYHAYTPHTTTHTIVNNVDNPSGNLDPEIFNLTYSDGSLETGHAGFYTFDGVYCSSGIPNESIIGKGK